MKSYIYLDVGIVGNIWDFVSKQIITVTPLVPQITADKQTGSLFHYCTCLSIQAQN